MRRFLMKGLAISALAALLLPIVAKAQSPIQVNGHYADAANESRLGGTPLVVAPDAADIVDSIDAPNTPGTLWDNGPGTNVNGLTSERRTFTTGTDGPEGDWIGAISEDFETLGTKTQIEEVRTCMFSNPTQAEIWFWADVNNSPPTPPNAANLANGGKGAPATAAMMSSTFVDNGSRCVPLGTYPGRQFQFSPATTVAQASDYVLNPGTYWLTSVGGPDAGGAGGGRAFWADSGNPRNAGSLVPNAPRNSGKWGGTVFGIPFWTDTSGQGQRDFAFDIDGRAAGGGVVRTVDPNRQLGNQVHLPILNFQGQDDVCRTMIEVQYLSLIHI